MSDNRNNEHEPDEIGQQAVDFDALAIVGLAVAEEVEAVCALEAAFQLPTFLPEHERPTTPQPGAAPDRWPDGSQAFQAGHRQRAQQDHRHDHDQQQDRQDQQQDRWATQVGDPVPSLADGRAPIAQGDVLVVPLSYAGRWPARYSIPGIARVVDSATGRPQHVLEHASTGTIWAPYTDPAQIASGAVGLLDIPQGGQVHLRHRGGDHDPLTIGPGLWLIRRQRAYAGAWTYNHLED